MHQHALPPEMDRCIQDCLACYRTCQVNASLHCLELGGPHVEPTHFRLMLDCVEACRSAAAMMLNGSPYAQDHCRICARICRDCARSCRELGDMDDCAAACERCDQESDGDRTSGRDQKFSTVKETHFSTVSSFSETNWRSANLTSHRFSSPTCGCQL